MSWSDVTVGPGSTQDVVNGVTFTAHNGYFTDKTTAGIGGIGVLTGNAEIGTTEDITITFPQSQFVNSLSLSMLYSIVSYDDNYANEIAQVTAISGGVNYVYTLRVDDEGLTATWTDITAGTFATINYDNSPGTDGYGGLWTLINPFGTMAIDTIVLTALDNGASGGANSDYCFNALETTATPIPGAVWLLGTGLLGLIGLRGRFKA